MTHPQATRREAAVSLPGLGERQLTEFVEAMGFELVDNAHKGDWLERCEFDSDGKAYDRHSATDAELLADALYHLVKLGRAMARGDRAAIHEYAADVGNCAMFCADKHDALAGDLAHLGPIEYDQEANTDPAWPDRAGAWRDQSSDWATAILAAMQDDARTEETT